MDQILGHILRQAVWERLDLLDELAAHADARSLASVAHTELPRLTGGWRALLAQHEPDGKGNCPSCSSRWRAQKAPCTVWQAAHQHLVAPETGKPTRTGRSVTAPVHSGHHADPRPAHPSERHATHHRTGQPSGHHHQRPTECGGVGTSLSTTTLR